MYAGAILDIHFVTDPYKVHISTNYRIEPYAAVISHNHVAGDRGVRREIAIISPFGRNTADREN